MTERNRTTRGAAALAAVLALACGGDASPDLAPDAAGRFELVDRAPAAGDPLWTGAPVRIELSAPIDAASVTARSVVVRGPAGALAATREVEGSSLAIALDEVPELPATVAIELTSGVRSADGRALEPATWSHDLPAWYRPGAASSEPAAAAAVLPHRDGAVFVAWIAGGVARSRRFDGAAWGAEVSAGAATDVDLATRGDQVFLAVAHPEDGVRVRPWDGDGWQQAAPVGDSLGAVAVALEAPGEVLHVAFATGSAIGAARSADAGWSPVGALRQVASAHVDLAPHGSGVAVAYDTAAGPEVASVGAEGWTVLGGPLGDPLGRSASLATGPTGVLHAAWLRAADDGAPATVRSAHLPGDTWEPLPTLRADVAAAVTRPPALAGGADRPLWIAWTETSERGDRLLVAEREGGAWRIGGPALTGHDAVPALAVDVAGAPLAGAASEAGVALAAWNRSPVPPLPHTGIDPGACALPSSPPPSLADTGCYADLAAHELIPGAIPYGVRAELWSDGAAKRRYLVLPEGGEVGYAEIGPWTFPVGAMLVKEFWIERSAGDPRTRTPVETRLLVKRCEEGACLEPWQGYSYRWNEGGTGATLLDGFDATRVDWDVTGADGAPAIHTHVYPSRFECIRCHALPAGRVLGLRAGQLAGAYDYGSAAGDQLGTLAALGVFGPGGANAAAPWPAPRDPAAPLAGRVRAYLHANCAHCHKRDLTGAERSGEAPQLDLRFATPLADTGLCDVLVPGDAGASLLHQRMAARGPNQMPPLSTDRADDAQLAVTAAWIDALAACP